MAYAFATVMPRGKKLVYQLHGLLWALLTLDGHVEGTMTQPPGPIALASCSRVKRATTVETVARVPPRSQKTPL